MGGKKTTIPISEERFEKALKKAGISKYRLAKEMPMDLRHLQRCINDYRAFSYKKLIRACEILNISPNDVIMFGTIHQSADTSGANNASIEYNTLPIVEFSSFSEYKSTEDFSKYANDAIRVIKEICYRSGFDSVLSVDDSFFPEHLSEIEELIATTVSAYIEENK